MVWNADISTRLHEAFLEERVEEFKALLKQHPSYLRDEDGTDFWMWKAATHGSLPMLQAVLELGLDVNETHDSIDPTDPFHEPEGPILCAAGLGHLDMVRWLLGAGAQINCVVQGQPRCMPLIRAAGEGHLDVVRLLVEHGADVNTTWQGLNAITQAERLGHPAIAEYLKSLSPFQG